MGLMTRSAGLSAGAGGGAGASGPGDTLDLGTALPEQAVQERPGRAEPPLSICSALTLCSLGLFFNCLDVPHLHNPHNAAQQDFCSELINR